MISITVLYLHDVHESKMVTCRVINSIKTAQWARFSSSWAIVFLLLNYLGLGWLLGCLVDFSVSWVVLVNWGEDQ
jgi:hypothetical protein